MTRLLALVLLATLAPALVRAQSLGTFRWQQQPYCNVLTLSVTQTAGVYTLDGYDDLCGAGQRASAVGIAFLNPDGSIGVGLTLVTAPGGAPLHLDATLSLASLGGTWRDSAGATGGLVFAPGPGSSGPLRPAPKAVFPGGLSAQGAPVTNVAPPVDTGDAATKGYVDGADAADRAYAAALVAGASLPPASRFVFRADGGFAALGTLRAGTIPVSGAGARLLWHGPKAALRAGYAGGPEWDDANVGLFSTATGSSTTASGDGSTAMGSGTTAIGSYSTATGSRTTADGFASTAMGLSTTARGDASTAMGVGTMAIGDYSTAMGNRAIAAGRGSFVYGDSSLYVSDVSSTLPNQFIVRAAGGVVFWSSPNTTNGPNVALFSGASAWSSLSDANAKENFRDLDGDDLLAKIARLPIREWNFKAQDASIRHVGPTAQDFHAAFGLGEDPLRISTIDADGIALAAVKALDARTREMRDGHRTLSGENQALKTEIAELRRSLEDVKKTLAALVAGPR